MCLALPGRVVSVRRGEDGHPRAEVDFGGTVEDVSLAYVEGVGVGEYVVVQFGFAVDRLDEADATALIADLEALRGG